MSKSIHPMRRAARGARRGVVAMATAAAACLGSSALAFEHDEHRFVLSGFGTLGLVHSSDDDADFTGGRFVPTGSGASDSTSHKVDSRVGAQVSAAFTDRWSAVVQVVSEQGADGGFGPEVEWANLRYSPDPDFSVRAGRIVLPVFMVADTRKVGYANPWIRPPVELYALAPLTSNDGVDATFRFRTGRWTHTTQASYGGAELIVAPDATVEARKLFGVYQSAQSGALTVRAAFVRTKLRFEALEPFFDGFRAFGPDGAAIADRYTIDGKRATLAGVGISYEPGDWFAMAEWGRQDTRSIAGEHTGWYASVGRRFGTLAPFVTVGRLRRDDPTAAVGLDTAGLPPALAGVAQQLNAGLNAGLSSTAQQRTLSAGVRWDFRPRVALKLQYDHVDIAAGSPGTFVNLQPAFERGGSVGLLGASLDFVF